MAVLLCAAGERLTLSCRAPFLPGQQPQNCRTAHPTQHGSTAVSTHCMPPHGSLRLVPLPPQRGWRIGYDRAAMADAAELSPEHGEQYGVQDHHQTAALMWSR